MRKIRYKAKRILLEWVKHLVKKENQYNITPEKFKVLLNTISYKWNGTTKVLQPMSYRWLVQTLKNATYKKTKGGSRQGSKYDQIDKLFATLVTKLNANATDKSIKWLNNNDLESIKKHITNARACISKA